MSTVITILVVILIIGVLIGCSALGWVMKGIGALLDVFWDGLGNFFSSTLGCLVDLFIIAVILAAIFG